MDEPIEDLYFNWLYSKVAYRNPSTPSTRFHSLLFYLHRTEFVWLLSGDDNRAADGQELRNDFCVSVRIHPDDAWMDMECSVFEMLVAFSARAAFQTDTNQSEWFWIMIDNLGLSQLSDSEYVESERARIIGPILYIFIWRQYSTLGHGGLFPLRYSEEDQTKVEIWQQFCEYLVDQNIS